MVSSRKSASLAAAEYRANEMHEEPSVSENKAYGSIQPLNAWVLKLVQISGSDPCDVVSLCHSTIHHYTARCVWGVAPKRRSNGSRPSHSLMHKELRTSGWTLQNNDRQRWWSVPRFQWKTKEYPNKAVDPKVSECLLICHQSKNIVTIPIGHRP